MRKTFRFGRNWISDDSSPYKQRMHLQVALGLGLGFGPGLGRHLLPFSNSVTYISAEKVVE